MKPHVVRYRQSAKGKAAAARAAAKYRASEKGKARSARGEAKRKGQRSVYEHKRSLKRLYGITPEQYQEILKDQKGRCKICQSTDPGTGKRRLAVDHDHRTGKVRGLLCNRCNQAIGLFRDDPVLMRAAIFYLVSP